MAVVLDDGFGSWRLRAVAVTFDVDFGEARWHFAAVGDDFCGALPRVVAVRFAGSLDGAPRPLGGACTSATVVIVLGKDD